MSSEKTSPLPTPAGQLVWQPQAATPRRRRSRPILVSLLLGCAFIAGAIRTSRLPAAAAPLPAPSSKHPRPGGNTTAVDWAPCPGREDEPYRCGFIDVPTDYANPSRGSHRLALAKIPARVSADKYEGVLWINPGGPGGSYVGRPHVRRAASTLADNAHSCARSGVNLAFRFPLDELLEGRYDVIVGFPSTARARGCRGCRLRC
jgi:hypothetical protein